MAQARSIKGKNLKPAANDPENEKTAGMYGGDEPPHDLIAKLPVGQKVIVRWARKWYQATVSEQGPVRMFKVHYKRWPERYNESVVLSQLLTRDGKVIPKERESELAVGWQGQAWWEGKFYNVQIIGHTWGAAKVHYDGLEDDHDAFYPADRIQLVNEKGECDRLVGDTPQDGGASNDEITPTRIEDMLDTSESMYHNQRNCSSMYSRTSRKTSSPTTRSAAKRRKLDTVLSSNIHRRSSEMSTVLPLPQAVQGPDVTSLMSLAQSLSSLVTSGLFSDIAFHCDDNVTLHAHRNILSVRSDYFKEFFATHPDEGVVDIEINSNAFKGILHYIYTGYVNVTFDSAIPLFEAANLCALTELKDVCLAAINQELNSLNVLKVYVAVSASVNSNTVKELCCQYIAKHYQEVTSLQEFARLEKQVMVMLIRDVSVYLKASQSY